MSKFIFQLEAVLRQRKLIEEQRQKDLASVRMEMTALEAELNAMDENVKSSTADLRENYLVGQLNLAFLAAHRRHTLAMQRKALNIAQRMTEVKKRIDVAHRALAEASVQRKILEKLREKRYVDWAKSVSIKDISALDEIAAQIGYRNSQESIS